MIIVLLLILVIILFSVIQLNVVQEMTIDFSLFKIGPFPMFYFVIAALLIGALCMLPTTIKYYRAYKKLLSYVRKKEKEELKFDKDETPIDFE